jgi:hypothetical protein
VFLSEPLQRQYGRRQVIGCMTEPTYRRVIQRTLSSLHNTPVRSLAKVRDDVFARFHAVAAKLRSRTQNSQFGLFGPVLRATTTAV